MRGPGILAVVMAIAMLALGWLSIAAITEGPRLELTASPKQGMSPVRIHLRAEIKGELWEDWRCPEVVWEMPDDTVAKYQEDCHPDYEPPRVWTRDIRISNGGEEPMEVPFSVRLYGPNGLLAVARVTVRVLP